MYIRRCLQDSKYWLVFILCLWERSLKRYNLFLLAGNILKKSSYKGFPIAWEQRNQLAINWNNFNFIWIYNEKCDSSVMNQLEMEFRLLLYVSTSLYPRKIKLIGNYCKVYKFFNSSYRTLSNNFLRKYLTAFRKELCLRCLAGLIICFHLCSAPPQICCYTDVAQRLNINH